MAVGVPGGEEGTKLAVVMVGLPARGKSYTAQRLARYLSWLGYHTRDFNVGEYRRTLLGPSQSHRFFDPRNDEGRRARRELAMRALDDMIEWLRGDGQVGIYDATNSTRERRHLVRERCEAAGLQVQFLELICEDPALMEGNIRETKLSSPDYANMDPDAAVEDFRTRIAHYESAYEPLADDEPNWVKIIDTGRRIVVNQVEGYLPGRLVVFLMNLHLTRRPIWITRHGESVFNTHGFIGGDPELTDVGKRYAMRLREVADEYFPDPEGLVICTSTLRRTVQTAELIGRKFVSWRALDEIDAGICDGMSYEQIQREMPEEFAARKRDKFNYRYPRGESYHDLIQRLDPVVLELERQKGPVLVIGHQAVLRALYAYFRNVPAEQCPYLPIPLHSVIQLTPHAYGCDENRVELKVVES